MKFTLVSTVFNEAKRLKQTIADLEGQTIKPAEIIITDAGSNDGTYEELLQWKNSSLVPIIVLQKNRCNVAEGRNLAIQAASYELIVSTDFGCRFEKNWLRTLVSPFEDKEVRVAGGAFGVVESDIQTKAAKAAYVLSGGYQIDATAPWFIPSSRSIAYYKSVYDAIGGYCEWLTLAADDLVFGKQMLKLGYRFSPVNHVGVFWGRHTQAKGYVKEAFRYGLGDGEARVNKRSFTSNLLETTLRYLFSVLLLINLVLVLSDNGLTWLLVLNVLLGVGFRPYIGYFLTWLKLKNKKYNLEVFLYGFYLLERTRLSYLQGYFKGWFYSTPLQKEKAKQLMLS
jgi:glycosyltransferase involved in cell wall biosynthesis